MPAISAKHHNPIIQAFCQRLLDAGMPHAGDWRSYAEIALPDLLESLNRAIHWTLILCRKRLLPLDIQDSIYELQG